VIAESSPLAKTVATVWFTIGLAILAMKRR